MSAGRVRLISVFVSALFPQLLGYLHAGHDASAPEQNVLIPKSASHAASRAAFRKAERHEGCGESGRRAVRGFFVVIREG